MQHLCWQMARNVRFSNRDLFVTIKQVLIRSLAYCKMIAEAITIAGKPIKMLSRQKGEASHYCSVCEVFSIFYLQIERFLIFKGVFLLINCFPSKIYLFF